MQKGHIFIQCASYRDSELRNTIRTAIDNANDPSKIVFGVCWQGKFNELKDQLCLRELKKCRTVLIEMESSRGIGYARHKAQQMFEGEEYVLQIDSHMKFLPGWDKLCLKMLNMCPSNKPLITAYLTDHRKREEPDCYRLGATEFGDDHNITITGMHIMKNRKPQLGILCSGHFLFCKSELFDDMPPDPNMQFLYEETLLAPRAWTNGWDIYYPHKAPMQHRWGRNYRKTNWSDIDTKPLEARCRKMYQQIIKVRPGFYNFGKYGLGEKRTLEQYQSFSGIDFKNKTLTKKAINGFPNNKKMPV